jgi:hypothetical protein
MQIELRLVDHPTLIHLELTVTNPDGVRVYDAIEDSLAQALQDLADEVSVDR